MVIFGDWGDLVQGYKIGSRVMQSVKCAVILAGFFSNLTPLFAALIWALWTGETPQLYHALAFLLIAGGIVVSSRR